MVRFRNKCALCFVQLVDLKAALFRKQQEYKKEKSSSLRVESSPGSSTVAAAQTAVEKAGRKVSDKVSVRCTKYTYICTQSFIGGGLVLYEDFNVKYTCNPDQGVIVKVETNF